MAPKRAKKRAVEEAVDEEEAWDCITASSEESDDGWDCEGVDCRRGVLANRRARAHPPRAKADPEEQAAALDEINPWPADGLRFDLAPDPILGVKAGPLTHRYPYLCALLFASDPEAASLHVTLREEDAGVKVPLGEPVPGKTSVRVALTGQRLYMLDFVHGEPLLPKLLRTYAKAPPPKATKKQKLTEEEKTRLAERERVAKKAKVKEFDRENPLCTQPKVLTIQSVGYDSLWPDAGKEYTFVQWGTDRLSFSMGKKTGMQVVAVLPGKKPTHQVFDTYKNGIDADRAFCTFVEGLPDGTAVAVFCADTIVSKKGRASDGKSAGRTAGTSPNLSTELYDCLASLGCSREEILYRQPLALVATKGSDAPAIEARGGAYGPEICRVAVDVTPEGLTQRAALVKSMAMPEFSALHALSSVDELAKSVWGRAAPREPQALERAPQGRVNIAIPSYKRTEKLTEMTMPFLKKHSVPLEFVHVFLANEEELEAYQPKLEGSWCRVDAWVPESERTPGVGMLVVGRPGIRKQRNFITRFFPESEYVVSFDDDIADVLVKKKDGEKNVSLKEGELLPVLRDAEVRMCATGAHLWALSYSENPLNMTTTTLRVGNGGTNAYVHGMIIRHLRSLKRDVCQVVEDQELALRFFERDGVVLRYSMFTVETDNRGSGGICAAVGGNAARREREVRAVNRLAREFPNLYRYAPKAGEGTNNSTFAQAGGPPLDLGKDGIWVPPSLRRS